MTEEEKAKAYDKALERAREIVNNKDASSIWKDWLKNTFPELKESEDERIRKELITHCRNTRCVTEEGAEEIAKWIAWLEKQGEQKMIQKPAEWAKCDDLYVNTLCEIVKNGSTIRPELRNEFIDWINSLKQRIGG